MAKFEVGKCYTCGEEGKTLYRIESRTEKTAVIARLYDDGTIAETMRKKIYFEPNYDDERIFPNGKTGTSGYISMSAKLCEVNNPVTTVAPEISTASNESVQPEEDIQKFLQSRSIIRKRKEITTMVSKYAEVSGTAREKNRKWRVKCLRLRRKLLREMSAAKIRRVCEEKRRRHTEK